MEHRGDIGGKIFWKRESSPTLSWHERDELRQGLSRLHSTPIRGVPGTAQRLRHRVNKVDRDIKVSYLYHFLTRVDKSHIFVAPGHKFQTPLNNNASSFLNALYYANVCHVVGKRQGSLKGAL